MDLHAGEKQLPVVSHFLLQYVPEKSVIRKLMNENQCVRNRSLNSIYVLCSVSLLRENTKLCRYKLNFILSDQKLHILQVIDSNNNK